MSLMWRPCVAASGTALWQGAALVIFGWPSPWKSLGNWQLNQTIEYIVCKYVVQEKLSFNFINSASQAVSPLTEATCF